MTRPIPVPISPGELLDKISILEIKSERIDDPHKRTNVEREYDMLTGLWHAEAAETAAITQMRAELKALNEKLWAIEDEIRDCERQGDFGDRFVELARSVYKTNDQRAALKRRINEALGSTILEEKSYKEY
ncbi:MAG: hypothetical protein KGY48_06920 [Wenzhouxiangellaceae bacterium]|jgi:hypothetical protein|nr:hypothetical protein [Wenzhouxiangellaceae bacterium]MBS3745962.1 hypothetical protein [Wenzhouxiangellaceae bacterium]MBS3823287.1 hypothetical protein [Wenzhouxiangellaceae bacterium]